MDEIDTIAPEGAGDSIGTRLRAAREERGLTLDEVAAATRVPSRHLQAIEAGDWDMLPAAPYTVGFARSYALAVGLDGPAIGKELREDLAARRAAPATAYYQPADPARVPSRALVFATLILMVLIGGGYMAWRNAALGIDEANAPEAATASAQPAAAPRVAPPPPAQAAGPVVVTAENEVWLRIYEAGGARLFEGTMKTGEKFEIPASAAQPLLLTGRPDAVQVSVGTTVIPQLGPAQRTIADVSLAPRDLLARLQPPAGPRAATPASTATAPPLSTR